MSDTDHVSITITEDTVGVKRPGFGRMIILSCKSIADSFAERARLYSDANEILDDFDADSPEYLAAAMYFSQDPQAEDVLIGRMVGQPTLAYTITPVVQNSKRYALTVSGEGFVTTLCEVTSDASATATEICDAFRTALNAVASKNYTASGTTTLIVTANAAAGWFAIDVEDVDDLVAVMNHAEPGTLIATDMANIVDADDSFYAVYPLYPSTAYLNALATWCEANDKILAGESCDGGSPTVVEGSGTDALDDFDEANYKNTAGIWHQYPSEFYGAGLFGSWLPLSPGGSGQPGKDTLAYKTVSGATRPPLSSTQRANLSARRATYMKLAFGFDVAWQGQVGDETRGFIDMTRKIDWLKAEVSSALGEALLAGSIDFTDEGISAATAAIRGAMTTAERKGVVASGWTVTAPKAEDISDADKANRLLPDLKFACVVRSPVHKCAVDGVISL